MDLISGYPYWLIHDGMPFEYPYLSQDEEASIAIIGGGISGALSAYYLTEEGIDCIMLDARDIGQGSTCGSTSLLQYELDSPLHVLIRKIGKSTAEKAYQQAGESIGKLIQVMDAIGFKDYERRNSLFFSRNDRQSEFMANEWKARKSAGFEVELLSQKSMRKDYGLDACYGILSSLGACINAYAFTHALLQHSIKKGLRVYARTKITGIDVDTGIKLSTDKGLSIRANKLIQASGYEVIKFIGKKWVNFDCTYAIVSECLQDGSTIWKDRIMMWNTDNPYLYLRLTKDKRIILGGRDDPFSNAFASDRHLQKKIRQLSKDFIELFPESSFRVAYGWCGTFGKTADSLPYIGSIDSHANIYYALGFGGNGISFSLIAAEILRDIILGRKRADGSIFSLDR
jgi:glycine/D-amino acid oxidase-like deaminating enzyme